MKASRRAEGFYREHSELKGLGAGLANWNKKRVNRWRGACLLKPLRCHKKGDDGDE